MKSRWGGGLGLALAVGISATAQAADYAPDDTGEVAAIQNRTYHMGQEFDFSLSLLPYDAFYKAITPEASYTFHFTDALAWEAVRFGYALDFDTNLKTQLLQLGAAPTLIEEVKLFLSSDVVWSPFYVKSALLNRYVLYGEIYGVLGGAAFDTTQAWRPAGNIGLGGRLFLNKVLSIKLEVRENLLIEQSAPSVVDINLGLGINFGASE